MSEKDSRKRVLKDHIDQVESKIADVDRKMLKAEGELETYYREALDKLNDVRRVADVQLERLHDSSEEAWDDLKDDVDEAIERLRFNLDSLMARLSADEVVKSAANDKRKSRSNDGKAKIETQRSGRVKRD